VTLSDPSDGARAFARTSGAERSVKPGLHRIEGGEVVFWDPRALPLGRVAHGGLRRTALLAPDEGGGRERVDAYYAWVDARAVARDKGTAPSWNARSVTAAAHATESTSHMCSIEQTDAPREGRASGKLFGTLVHAILAECALDADADALRAMARYQGRLLDASEAEVAAAITAVAAALAHPRLVEARGSADVRRECPITVPLEDGSIAEGVIDLAYRTDAGWVIVDFKTDRELGEKVPHAVQLSIYARAVAAATGEPATTVLLYV